MNVCKMLASLVIIVLSFIPLISCQGYGGRNTVANTTTASSSPVGDRHRVVGGIETAEHEFPWMASMSKQGQHFCGAAIVHTSWILTAAHCINDVNFQIKAGEHNIEASEGTEQIVGPSLLYIHPQYNASTFENDIALIKVSPAFKFDGYVKAIDLPRRIYVATGNATVAGWGTTSEGSHLTSAVLLKVTVPLIPNIKCAEQYGNNFVPAKMMCAGETEGGKDSCQGDSGGPLMCKDIDKINLCGVVSYGYGCARVGYAGVYTKVTSYLDWIEGALYRSAAPQPTPSANSFNATQRPTSHRPSSTFVPWARTTRNPNYWGKSSASNLAIIPIFIFYFVTILIL